LLPVPQRRLPGADTTLTGGVLLLAAGFSRRFGGDKRRHPLDDGTPLLLASLACHAAAFEAVTVVLRPEDDDLAHSVLAAVTPARVRVVRCADALRGMGRSLACGAAACADWDYLFVGLADMAWIRTDTLVRLREAMAEGTDPQRIVLPVYRGTPGHPVGFAAAYLPALAVLDGDAGARAVLAGAPQEPVRIEVDDPGVLRDADRPDDAG
jgi:molybdenum cofactor cytidylyltransferase